MNSDFELPYARLVTLAPGLRPERRFAPLARGLEGTDLGGMPWQNCHGKRLWLLLLQLLLLVLPIWYL